MSYFNSATIPHIWTNQDTGNAILASVVPVGIGCTMMAASKEHGSYRFYLDRAIKPSWASPCAGFHSGMSLLTLSPLGYASYRIIKNTAGLASTRSKIAFGIYAASMFLAASTGSAVKAGCYAGVAFNKVGVAVTALAFTLAFHRLDETAFWYSVPFTLWSTFSALYHFRIHQLNTVKKP